MLNSIIQTQTFEQVRDSVGRVLAAEIANQKHLIELYNVAHKDDPGFVPLTVLAPAVFIGRENTIDENEMPLINILIPEIGFEDTSAISSLGDIKLFIELYVASPSTPNGSGDVLSSTAIEKIAGQVRAILMDNKNRNLDFVSSVIRSRHVLSYTRTRPRAAADTTNSISAVIEAHYFAEETTEQESGLLETYLGTTVKLNLTNKGYRYECS